MYELKLTRKAQKFYQEADDDLARRLNRCFEQLRQDPLNHPNIKSLRGSFVGSLRYRVGDWRVIYSVDREKATVTILLIVHRREAYRM